MGARIRSAPVAVAVLLGVSGFACTEPEAPRSDRPLDCDSLGLRFPPRDAPTTLEWASFQTAEMNQEALAPLSPEERLRLFEACVLPVLKTPQSR